MAKFCGKCGSQLDELTGLCPVCDINEKTVSLYGNANDTGFDFDKTMASDNVYSAPADTQFLGYENTQQSFVPEVPVVKEEIKNTKEKKENNPKKEKKANKEKKSKRSKGLTLFITILLSFCLFLTSTISLVLFDVRNAISEDNADEILENIEVVTILENTNPDAVTYMEDFFDFLYKEFRLDISKNDLNDLFEQEEVQEYVGGLVSDFADDIFDGSIAKVKITRSDIADLVIDCSEYIDDEYNVSLSYKDADKIAEWILPDGDIVVINSDDFSTLATVARFTLSYVTIVLFMLLSAFLIFLLIRNNLSQAAMGGGIVYLTLGGLTGIAVVLVLIPSLFKTICGVSFILGIVGNILLIGAVVSAVLFAIGLLSIVARIVVKKIIKKKNA